MASHYPSSRRSDDAINAAARLGRDITWGRILFLPPELANPRVIFDPTPFRTHEFAGVRTRKSPYTR
jgi:hypothetical protein